MNKIQFPELFKYQKFYISDKINLYLSSDNYHKKMSIDEFIFRFNDIDIVPKDRVKLLTLYNKLYPKKRKTSIIPIHTTPTSFEQLLIQENIYTKRSHIIFYFKITSGKKEIDMLNVDQIYRCLFRKLKKQQFNKVVLKSFLKNALNNRKNDIYPLNMSPAPSPHYSPYALLPELRHSNRSHKKISPRPNKKIPLSPRLTLKKNSSSVLPLTPLLTLTPPLFPSLVIPSPLHSPKKFSLPHSPKKFSPPLTPLLPLTPPLVIPSPLHSPKKFSPPLTPDILNLHSGSNAKKRSANKHSANKQKKHNQTKSNKHAWLTTAPELIKNKNKNILQQNWYQKLLANINNEKGTKKSM
jgi:hypothetical protein